MRNGRLAGAIVMGDGGIVPSLLHAFAESTLLAENRAEMLFRSFEPATAAPTTTEAVPDTAQICNCNGVSKAQIIEAVLGGARSMTAVCDCDAGDDRMRLVPARSPGHRRAGVPRACRSPSCSRPAIAPTTRRTLACLPEIDDVVVTLNKIERLKREKDGLDIIADVPRLAQEGWQALDEGDRERLKWAGVFFRRQTPGRFMMRIRMSNGQTNAAQLRAIAEISRDVGAGFVDITTRQQIQLRGFDIGDVPEIWKRLEDVGSGLAADRHGQHPERDRLSGGRADAARAVRCLAGRARVHRHVPEKQGLHEPAAQVQRRHQRVPRALHARRVAGPRR